jgi:hypothetical protein
MAVSGSARLDVALLRPIPCHCCGYRSPREWQVILRLDVVLRCQLHAIVAATPLPESIVICHRRGFRGDSPGMDLATLDTRRRRYNSSRQRETGTAALSADMGREPIPMSSVEPMSSPCWIGLAQGFTESDRAVLLEEDVRWERGYHTWCEPLAGPRYGSKDTSEARAVRTACGGIVESAPERQLLGPPLPASEKVTRTSRYFRVG